MSDPAALDSPRVAACPSCAEELPGEFLFCPFCGASLAGVLGVREQRKTVTLLFCDITGSTQLGEETDAEALRALLVRYFERMKAIVESHGGTVEKFIGDAVMAVFGIPQVHEDDALRACRAAIEMRDALPDLHVQARIGVTTGEVVAATDETLATGDAVNTAARLEQAAAPGEILIGEPTLKLVHEAVEAEPVEALALKGKAEPVPAYRLRSLLAAPERLHVARFVGRERELALIRTSWEQARSEARCELLTVVGEAGVGKSRLVAEALALVECRAVSGRCLPYGEGITYWPLVEVLKQLNVLPSDPAAAASIRSLLGESEEATSAEEIAWAFRKLLEEQAPLVVVFDDVQWAEETFLDLVEAAALLTRDAPLLILCMARPELIELRASWPAPVRLEPLAADEAEELLPDTFDHDLRARIARAAGGNPLFLTEMVAMAGEADGKVAVPATLRALLAARLDQLEPDERAVLERGAVEGEIFHRGAVQALSPNGQVTPRLAALVRKGLIRPDRAQLPGEDAFRFHHLLLRDAAYDAVPKSVRADLHARFAQWLEQRGTQLVELDELLGYHLEQAARYLDELGQDNRELAVAAGDQLGVAGRRAFWRGDWGTATGLLERALSLTRPYRLDLRLEVELTEALHWIDPARRIAVADAAAQRAAAAGDETGAALARTVAAMARMHVGQSPPDEVERLAREALLLLEAAEDDDGLVHVWYVLSWVANMRQHFEDWAQAMEAAFRHARRTSHPVPGVFTLALAIPLTYGPRPASEALATLDAVIADQPYAGALLVRGVLLAMLDRIDEAWAVALPAEERFRELGLHSGSELAEIAFVAGDYEAAAAHLRAACDALERTGNMGELSTFAPLLGRALCELGRYDEAELLAERGRELGAPEDVATQMAWRRTQALVHSARGQHAEAKRLACESIDYSLRSDSPLYQGNAFRDLATVLAAAGQTSDAAAALEQALERYERKGDLPDAARVRAHLQELEDASRPPRTIDPGSQA
jgi:class 3 adenylate cyclase/tetratricopeptide (TPR) repeat protein